MNPRSAKNTHNARVIRHLPIGLHIELENGQRGIVRIREISWDANIRNNWRNHYQLGWRGKVIAIDSPDEQDTEFSLRLIEYDPWEILSEEEYQNKAFDGIVANVVSYGAFIELEDGLTGLLHQDRLPSWAGGKRPMELFWPGDRVRVVIENIEAERRRLNLGLPLVSTAQEVIPEPDLAELSGRFGTSLEEIDEFLREEHKRFNILLVEDEEEQSWSVSNWLQRLDQHVATVENAEEAIKFLETGHPDIALVDVGLPRMNGIDLANFILEKYPHIRVINATDWARADRLTSALNDLQTKGVELLMKPLLPEDLLRILKQEKAQPTEMQQLDTGVKTALRLSRITNIKTSGSLKSLLQLARKKLGFELAILFVLNANNRSISIKETAGEAEISRHAINSLIYSPVRDVAEDNNPIFLEELQPGDHSRFKYLLELFPLRACVGIPIPNQAKLNFALFLLDKHARSISDEQKIYAEAISLAIGSALEYSFFQERSILIQRTALMGHLTSALVHEINNQIGPLSTRVDAIQLNVGFLEKRHDSPEVQATRIQQIASELDGLQNKIKKVIHTAKMYGRIIKKGQDGIIRVDEIIKDTIDLLEYTSKDMHVSIHFTPAEELVVIRSQAGTFEQVLLNVMLNAVQQIHILRPEFGGRVQVWLDLQPEDAQPGCFQILIEDNGPGIHASLWETVFEAGYTTRQDGSGIGLYISKSMVDEIGGRLFIKESRILGGTTFALEIPRHL